MRIFSAGLTSQAIEDCYDGSMTQATRESLVAAYNFAGDSRTVRDTSRNGHNGTIYGNVVRRTGVQTVSISTSSLPAGSDLIQANYGGDANYQSESPAGELPVSVAADVVATPSIDSGLVPASPQAGTPITLSAASPNYLDTYTWTVTLGAEPTAYATGAGTSFSFTPDMAGATYTVTLTATDSAGTAAPSVPDPIYVYGTSPTLTITGAPSTSVPEGTPLALSASMSNPTSWYRYTWTVTVTDSAAPVSIPTTTGARFGLTPDVAGTYTISLAATDQYGQMVEPATTTSITVKSVAPAAIFNVTSPTMTPNGTETVTASFSNAYVPSSSNIQYYFAYALASQTPPTLPSYDTAAGTTTSSFQTFTFDESGIYTIWGEVIDADGLSTTYHSTLVVNNLPYSSGSSSDDSGSSTSISGSSDDSGMSGGDGSSSAAASQRPTVGSIEVTPGSADTSTPPIVTIATGATSATLLVNASENGDSGPLSYAWNYVALSGGATTVTIVNGDFSEPNSADATFNSAGNYRFTVTVTDQASGLTATSVVDVALQQTLKTINVSSADTAPADGNLGVAAGGNEVFFADCLDQFGNEMAVQPSVTWSAEDESGSGDDAGKIDSTGFYGSSGFRCKLDGRPRWSPAFRRNRPGNAA